MYNGQTGCSVSRRSNRAAPTYLSALPQEVSSGRTECQPGPLYTAVQHHYSDQEAEMLRPDHKVGDKDRAIS